MEVRTGSSVSAKATGSEEALERVSLRVEGRAVLLRAHLWGWGGYPGKQSAPARIVVTTPDLATAGVVGPGRLSVDRMRGARVSLTVEGPGQIAVRSIEADNVSLAVAGSGAIEAAGRAKQALAVARGVAEIRAGELVASDLTLTSESAGAVTMNATRSAKVTALGAGPVMVAGSAACEVRKLGSGPLSCGK